ncbi:MAG: helix-turn-helix domain-containing protein [Gemmatimonadetes bacterium]|nr:helix-turn-helix domain-containing protein [Gemmatimonadota bacterium]
MVHDTYVGRLERGESGVTVEALAAILAALGVSLGEFFKPFTKIVKPRTPRRRG